MITRNIDALLSIGDLAAQTGLTVLRIRAWEQRYGIPKASRTELGHRRYTRDEAMRLGLVAEAVARGCRIGEAAHLPLRRLRELTRTGLGSDSTSSDPWLAQQLDLARHANEAALTEIWDAYYTQHGWLMFVDHLVVPLTKLVGDSWEQGHLSIAEEHLVSGLLENFIENKWRQVNNLNKGRPWVLSLLEGDQHALGLQLCALAISMAGRPVIYLGSHASLVSVVGAASGWNAQSVCISISIACPADSSNAQLRFLRNNLDKGTLLCVGGAGFQSKIKGVVSSPTIGGFYDLVQSH